MITAQDSDPGQATNPDGKDSFRIPSPVLPLLATRCLATATVLQLLGVSAPVFSPLFPLGLVFAAIGLAAYACVRSGRIDNGWAFLGLVPVLGLLIGVLQRRLARGNSAGNRTESLFVFPRSFSTKSCSAFSQCLCCSSQRLSIRFSAGDATANSGRPGLRPRSLETVL